MYTITQHARPSLGITIVSAITLLVDPARMTEEDATIEHISVTEKDAFTSIVDVILTVRDRIHLADILRRARSLKPVRRIYRVKNK